MLRQIITLVALSSGACGLSGFSFHANAQSAAVCHIRPHLCKKKLLDSTFKTVAPATADAVAPTVKRGPANSNSNFSFNAYMTANASHPALNSRIRDHQNAFVDTARPATFLLPGEGSSIKESEPVPPTAPPTALPASSSSTGSAAASAPTGAPFR